jgi:hypothetical protein
VRRPALQPAELRVLRECLRIGRVQRRHLRSSVALPSESFAFAQTYGRRFASVTSLACTP